MTLQTSKDAFGYPFTPFRIEFRPRTAADSRDELLAILDALAECGVQAWWYSVAAKGSYPLFPSKHLPYLKAAATEIYPWLTEQAHARGISIFSWEYLTTAPLLAQEHPEWRFRFLDWNGQYSQRDGCYVCYNSPYGELLKKYCDEVVNELGFDGIWFDGSGLFSQDGMKVACCCRFCAEKYRKSVGQDIPLKIDFSSNDFKCFLEWRYADFSGYWEELVEHVKKGNSDAILAFNLFNRKHVDWKSGIALRRKPMACLSVSEGDFHPLQLMLQHKILKAVNDHYPSEVWIPGLDGTHTYYPLRPNPEPASLLLHCRISFASGGYASIGIDNPLNYKQTLKTLTEELGKATPYLKAEPVRSLGFVVSGATKDYAYWEDPWAAWKSAHGMHNLLTSIHYPSDVLLDNMLTLDHLTKYQAIILPDVQCLSDESADQLMRYVNQGGYLIGVGDIGTRTYLGEIRPKGALDDLFGITFRDNDYTYPVMRIRNDMLKTDRLPEMFMISGPAHLVRSNSADVLADCPTPNTRSAQNASSENEGPMHVIISKPYGKGYAVYMTQNVGLDYAANPNFRSREIVRLLLNDRIIPPFHTDASPNIVIVPFKKKAQLIFHIVNMPWAPIPASPDSICHYWPEDFTPTAAINITVKGNWAKAFSPLNPDRVTLNRENDHIHIKLNTLEQYELIVLQGEQ